MAEITPFTEGASQLNVVVFAHEHSPYNLESAQAVLTAFQSQLDNKKDGIGFIFLETDAPDPSHPKFIETTVTQMGFTSLGIISSFVAVNGSFPTPTAIPAIRDQIDQLDNYSAAVAQGLLIPEQLYYYHFFRGLDRLGRTRGIHPVVELHDNRTYRKSAGLIDRYNTATRLAKAAWWNGDFNEALDAYQGFYPPMLEDMKLREIDIVKSLVEAEKRLLRSKNGGVLFVPIGQMHSGMVPFLERKLTSKAPVTVLVPARQASDQQRIIDAYRKGDEILDELYAKALVFDLLSNAIAMTIAGNRLFEAGWQYNQLLTQADIVVENLDTDAIRRLCIGGEKAMGEVFHSILQTVGVI